MIRKDLSICITGWHYFEDFLKQMEKIKDNVFIVGHKYNALLENFDHEVIDNIGLEFGIYSWFLNNKWDEKSDILMIHDDISINNIHVINDISNEAKSWDQAYIWNNKKEAKKNGYKHGRCIYLSREIGLWFLKNDGIWFDNLNKGYTGQEGRLKIDYHNGKKYTIDYNNGIRRFHKKIKIAQSVGFTRTHIYNDKICLYRRGF